MDRQQLFFTLLMTITSAKVLLRNLCGVNCYINSFYIILFLSLVHIKLDFDFECEWMWKVWLNDSRQQLLCCSRHGLHRKCLLSVHHYPASALLNCTPLCCPCKTENDEAFVFFIVSDALWQQPIYVYLYISIYCEDECDVLYKVKMKSP